MCFFSPDSLSYQYSRSTLYQSWSVVQAQLLTVMLRMLTLVRAFAYISFPFFCFSLHVVNLVDPRPWYKNRRTSCRIVLTHPLTFNSCRSYCLERMDIALVSSQVAMRGGHDAHCYFRVITASSTGYDGSMMSARLSILFLICRLTFMRLRWSPQPEHL